MKKSIISLALAVVAGTFAMAQENAAILNPQQKKMQIMKHDPVQRDAHRLERMKKELNLTEDQVAKIKALQDKRKQEIEAVRQKNNEEREARKAAMDAGYKRILTPEQYQKWNTQRKERAEKIQRKSALKHAEAIKK